MTTTTDTVRWWHRIGGLPFAVFILVLCNTVLLARVAIDGLVAGNMDASATVVSILQIIATLVLLLSLLYWVRDLFRKRTYETAKSVSSAGLLIVVAVNFGWLVAIRGDWRPESPAFPTAVLAILTLVLIHSTSQAWVRNRHGEGPTTGSIPRVAPPK